MNKKYISVGEFARIRRVSPQAIYKQLPTKLKDYVVIIDGHKRLKIQILEDFGFVQKYNKSNKNNEAHVITLKHLFNYALDKAEITYTKQQFEHAWLQFKTNLKDLEYIKEE